MWNLICEGVENAHCSTRVIKSSSPPWAFNIAFFLFRYVCVVRAAHYCDSRQEVYIWLELLLLLLLRGRSEGTKINIARTALSTPLLLPSQPCVYCMHPLIKAPFGCVRELCNSSIQTYSRVFLSKPKSNRRRRRRRTRWKILDGTNDGKCQTATHSSIEITHLAFEIWKCVSSYTLHSQACDWNSALTVFFFTSWCCNSTRTRLLLFR